MQSVFSILSDVGEEGKEIGRIFKKTFLKKKKKLLAYLLLHFLDENMCVCVCVCVCRLSV